MNGSGSGSGDAAGAGARASPRGGEREIARRARSSTVTLGLKRSTCTRAGVGNAVEVAGLTGIELDQAALGAGALEQRVIRALANLAKA